MTFGVSKNFIEEDECWESEETGARFTLSV